MDVADQFPDGQIPALAQNELGQQPGDVGTEGGAPSVGAPRCVPLPNARRHYSWHLELSFH
jgi:hypothetical protein